MFTRRVGTEESPSIAVAEAVASVTNTPITDLEPLNDVVDTDSLDKILGS